MRPSEQVFVAFARGKGTTANKFNIGSILESESLESCGLFRSTVH